MAAESLKKYLRYDPESGHSFWIKKGTRNTGKAAGRIGSQGYRIIMIHGKKYQAHRVAWLLFYGEWPLKSIDHKNGIRDDNRINNLREADNTINQQNKATVIGVTGTFPNRSGRWGSRIRVNGKYIHLGSFDTRLEAYERYVSAKTEMHHGWERKSESSRLAAIGGEKGK